MVESFILVVTNLVRDWTRVVVKSKEFYFKSFFSIPHYDRRTFTSTFNHNIFIIFRSYRAFLSLLVRLLNLSFGISTFTSFSRCIPITSIKLRLGFKHVAMNIFVFITEILFKCSILPKTSNSILCLALPILLHVGIKLSPFDNKKSPHH